MNKADKENIIDISIPTSNKLPTWPGVQRPVFNKISSMEKGDKANDTKIQMSEHTGIFFTCPYDEIFNEC